MAGLDSISNIFLFAPQEEVDEWNREVAQRDTLTTQQAKQPIPPISPRALTTLGSAAQAIGALEPPGGRLTLDEARDAARSLTTLGGAGQGLLSGGFGVGGFDPVSQSFESPIPPMFRAQTTGIGLPPLKEPEPTVTPFPFSNLVSPAESAGASAFLVGQVEQGIAQPPIREGNILSDPLEYDRFLNALSATGRLPGREDADPQGLFDFGYLQDEASAGFRELYGIGRGQRLFSPEFVLPDTPLPDFIDAPLRAALAEATTPFNIALAPAFFAGGAFAPTAKAGGAGLRAAITPLSANPLKGVAAELAVDAAAAGGASLIATSLPEDIPGPLRFALAAAGGLASAGLVTRAITRHSIPRMANGIIPSDFPNVPIDEALKRQLSIDKLTDVIHRARPITRDIRTQTEAELASGFATFRQTTDELIAQGVSPEEALRRGAAAMAGPTGANRILDPMRPHLRSDEVDSLFRVVAELPSETQALEGRRLLTRVLDGEVPTLRELGVLEEIFGPSIPEALLRHRPPASPAEVAQALISIPRTMLTILDMSAALRQGGTLGPSHPRAWANAFTNMHAAFVSEPAAQAFERAIKADPLFQIRKQYGSYHAPLSKIASIGEREQELLAATLLERVPVIKHAVRASERAYVEFLNGQRDSVWKTFWNSLPDPEGLRAVNPGAFAQANERAIRRYSKFINYATGRGGAIFGENNSGWWNGVLFSQRLLTSRFQLPFQPIHAMAELAQAAAEVGPRAAWQASEGTVFRKISRDLAAFATAAPTVLGAFKAAERAGFLPEGWSVETDPRSSDWGKVKMGDTRIDILAGYQQIIRYFSQVATGEVEPVSRDDEITVDRFDQFFRFVRSKLSPLAGIGYDLISGETPLGEDARSSDRGAILERFFNTFTPLIIQEAIDAYQAEGAGGIFKTVPSTFYGFGATSFDNLAVEIAKDVLPPERQREINWNKPLAGQLLESEWDVIRETDRWQNEYGDLELELPDFTQRVALYDTHQQTLEQEWAPRILALEPGFEQRQAIQEFLRSRAGASDAIFDDAEEVDRPRHAVDIIAERYWSVEMEQEIAQYADGQVYSRPNFDALERQRQEILAEARPLLKAAGLTTAYITGSGEGTYRGQRFENEDLAAVIEDYESDARLVRPYWKIADEWAKEFANITGQQKIFGPGWTLTNGSPITAIEDFEDLHQALFALHYSAIMGNADRDPNLSDNDIAFFVDYSVDKSLEKYYEVLAILNQAWQEDPANTEAVQALFKWDWIDPGLTRYARLRLSQQIP